jgi:uncharacterized protein YlxW (UPF0749 family)
VNTPEIKAMPFSSFLFTLWPFFICSIMKRNFSTLQREKAERDDEERRRRYLQRLNDAELRAERLEQAKKAEVAQLRASIKKWKEENVISATNFEIVEPEPIPLGTQLFPAKSFMKLVEPQLLCPALIRTA